LPLLRIDPAEGASGGCFGTGTDAGDEPHRPPAAPRQARPSCARWPAARGSVGSRTVVPGRCWCAAGPPRRRRGTDLVDSCARPCGSGRGRGRDLPPDPGGTPSPPAVRRSAAGPWAPAHRQGWPGGGRPRARRRSPGSPPARARPCRRVPARSVAGSARAVASPAARPPF
jgi:hypothetical protein